MNADRNHDREEQALDALIVWALRHDLAEDRPEPDLEGPQPVLSAEHREALEALGPDLVARILAGTWQPRQRPSANSRPGKRRLTGSLHRGEDDDEVTDRARREMERKVQDQDAEDQEEPQP